MIPAFIAAVAFTLGVSFFCSLSEALILSTTVAEIEALKKVKPRLGEMLERLKTDLSSTMSAILTLNTIANTAGSAVVGFLAAKLFGDAAIGVISALLTLGILIFSEVIPKNLGVIYRVSLQPYLVGPLSALNFSLKPLTYLTNKLVDAMRRKGAENASNEDEIILLAEKGAKEGTLTSSESSMVTNALKLDDVLVSAIMTPRIVVTALEKNMTIGEVFEQYHNIPFARIPIYSEEIDNVVGIVRRRDLLRQKADGNDALQVAEITDEPRFAAETITAAAALQIILKTHQQLLVVVDEFGSLAGVVTMEDIMEYILGREIFEKDDVAIDMRELARHQTRKLADTLAKKQSSQTSAARKA